MDFAIAFSAGIVTFFASCLLPMVPTYMAYITGIGLKNKVPDKKHIISNAIIFVIGFVSVFVILGIISAHVGSLFARNKEVVIKLGGVFLILMGLIILKIISPQKIKLPTIVKTRMPHTRWDKINSLIFGITFGLAWTPCIGPVLGSILFWASQKATEVKGGLLLLMFGIGMGVPFILVAVFLEKILPKLKRFNKAGYYMNIAAGALILTSGIALVFNKYSYLSLKMIQLFGLQSLSS